MTSAREPLIEHGLRRKTYRLSKVALSPGNRVMYHMKDGLERVFVKEELMLTLKDTELPLDYVQKW